MVQVESGGMNEVPYQLCRHNVSIMDDNFPVPLYIIAEPLGLTRNQARYRLRELKRLGLVKHCREVVKDEYGCFPCIGWRLTDKAKETEEYKKAWEKERELSKKFSDMMDIGEQE